MLVLNDQDGNKVGRQHIDCLASEKNRVCTFVSKIVVGPNADKGTVVGIGAMGSGPATRSPPCPLRDQVKGVTV